MTELKPCPKGCDSFIDVGTREIDESWWSAIVRCADCGIELRRGAQSEKEALEKAIEAWNTRAERTCEIARVETGEPAEYDCDEVLWHCASCHEEVAIYAYNEDGDIWADKPAFCPNCGAKVVE